MPATPRFLAVAIALDPRPGLLEAPIRAAFLLGRKAARSGRLRRSNPYANRLTRRETGRVAWSVLADYWELGYDQVPGFTVKEKIRAIGNGVPLAMGRAVAAAVARATA